jgi:hypothetical protein
MGPSVIDTVGPDPLAGDSLWTYWQNYATYSESLIVVSKPATGLAVKRLGLSWDDSTATHSTVSGKGDWVNGRGLDYDGSSVWTSSVWLNTLIRRNPLTGAYISDIPGPSRYGLYGTYGLSVEATDAAGVPYAPVGSVAYVPGAVGNKFYMYCAAMDEGKVYKVDITGVVCSTPPDSVKVTALTATSNKIKWWKTNVDVQKVKGYGVYRQALGSTTPPVLADLIGSVNHRYGFGVADSFIDNSAKGGKAAWVYTIKSSNYYSAGEWGASENAPFWVEDSAKAPGAIELTNFALSAEGYNVLLQWTTASETDNYQWVIKRSADGLNYKDVAILEGAGNCNTGKSYSHTDVVETEGTYYYQLYDIDTKGRSTLSGQLTATVDKIPVNYELSQNYPNPVSRGATTVKFALKNPGKVSLVVYNVLGEQVRTLANDTRKAGFYTVKWDGSDDKGRQVSNGIYFYKLISGEFQSTKKLTVLK